MTSEQVTAEYPAVTQAREVLLPMPRQQ